ncbi:hypothetical protein ACFSCX_06810 [Bacillus salitolerans]|uniref:Uncharacterized protein n=1 Tax=Bacillus salitolerans TaxID=1437434 RepID=A0ABW4LM57_9BACI
MSKDTATNIQRRVIEAAKSWDEERLHIELGFLILTQADEKLEELFFDDIATEEEHKESKLFVQYEGETD